MDLPNLKSIVAAGKNISAGCLNLIDSMNMPRLKVAIITYYYEKPSLNGTAIHAQNLTRALMENGCEVHVFCSGKDTKTYVENNITVHTFGKILPPTVSNIPSARLVYDLFEVDVMKAAIMENTKKPFDIVHTHGELIKSAFMLKKIYGVKWIHTFHAVEKLRVKELSAEEKEFGDIVTWMESVTKYCNGTIFVSKDLLREGLKHYKLKSKRVIPNGVDLRLFNFNPIAKKNVLFIGRFNKDKGIHHIPAIIRGVMSVKDATFTMCSPYETPTPELRKIEVEINKLKNQHGERIRMILEPQKQESIRELYKACQVYIQPSKYESFGLCIIEAMATGRPAVAFKVGGIPEVIGDAGFTVGNLDELIKKVKVLLLDKELCEKIGKKASERAKLFDWKIIAKKTIQYYKEVLK